MVKKGKSKPGGSVKRAIAVSNPVLQYNSIDEGAAPSVCFNNQLELVQLASAFRRR